MLFDVNMEGWMIRRLNSNSRGVSHKIPLGTWNRNQLLMTNVIMHEIRLLVFMKTFINFIYDGSDIKPKSSTKWYYLLFGSLCMVYRGTVQYLQIRKHVTRLTSLHTLLRTIGNITTYVEWKEFRNSDEMQISVALFRLTK